jgi:PEP-CTERM motif
MKPFSRSTLALALREGAVVTRLARNVVATRHGGAKCATALELGAAALIAMFGGALVPTKAQAQGYVFHTLNDPADPPFNGVTFTNLLGINNSGLIAGFYGSGQAGDPNKGFLLTLPSTFVAGNFPGSAQTQLTGLNNTGVVTGYLYKTNNGVPVDNQFGFYETGGNFVQVNNPKTPTNPPAGVLIENQLIGVNDHNIAVGFYNDASGNSHGYTYTISTGAFSPDINDPNAVSTVAAAINNSGEIAGFYTDAGGVIHGFLDNNGQFTTVDPPGSTETELLGLNDQGIAVGFDMVGGVMQGLVFNSVLDMFTTLDPNGSEGTTLNGINDLGDIVGFFVDGASNTDGLLAIPVPEPQSWTMMLAGFAALGFIAYRRSRKGEVALVSV